MCDKFWPKISKKNLMDNQPHLIYSEQTKRLSAKKKEYVIKNNNKIDLIFL